MPKLHIRSFEDAVAHIAAHYRFEPSIYPALQGMTEAHAMEFALKHLLLHMQKNAGVVAAHLEGYDHSAAASDVNDLGHLREAAVKMFIDVIKLADVLDMSAGELCRRVGETVKIRD